MESFQAPLSIRVPLVIEKFINLGLEVFDHFPAPVHLKLIAVPIYIKEQQTLAGHCMYELICQFLQVVVMMAVSRPFHIVVRQYETAAFSCNVCKAAPPSLLFATLSV